MMRRILLLWCCLSSPLWAAVDEFELKANFIFRFAQYTSWPPPPAKETLFCVLGQKEIFTELEKFKDRKINGVPVKVIKISAIKASTDCQVVFIGAQEPLSTIMPVLRPLPILVIGDSAEAFDEKALIVLVTEPNRVSFKINRTQASQLGLVMSAQLLKLAKEVR